MIEDSYCQGPKPRETESCEASRRRREDRSAADGKHGLFAARSNALTRKNDFIKTARGSAETSLSNDDSVGDPHPNDLSSPAGQAENPPGFSCPIGTVNTLPKKTDLIPSDDSIRNSLGTDRFEIGKRSANNKDEIRARKIKKDEVVIDKEDIRNLTLTIILERDRKNVITNFPKDFEPQPSGNSTEFTLIGMDALRYIQRIQEEARSPPEVAFFRKQRARIA